MKIKDLVKNVEVVKIIGDDNIDVERIIADSKSATPKSMFICLKGENFDGHNYVRQAEMYGATAILCEKECDTSLTQVIVKNTRESMAIVASEFFNNASHKMKIVGITGTNGKTTTAHLIKSILDGAGVNCGIIGTLGTRYKGVSLEPTLTTPDPLELHRILYDMYRAGVKVVVMEVSAHALALNKLEGIKFAVGVFTNLTQDHLDFFGDMESYKRAKLKLFEENRCKYCVVNSDDSVGVELINSNKNVVSYGINNPADVFAIDIKEDVKGTEFILNLFDCIYNVKSNLIGTFNVYNLLASSVVASLLGVTTEKTVEELNNFTNVIGRLEKVYSKDYSIFVDYAHTPDGLKNVLTSLRKTCKGRLINVFGCGGNRDSIKRSIMGRISGEYAHFTIITSDNPRYEEPMQIISQIEKGVLERTKQYVIVQDRIEAIKYAINYAKKDDVILIAGKGAENYQEILGIKHVYNDKDTVRELLTGKSNEN